MNIPTVLPAFALTASVLFSACSTEAEAPGQPEVPPTDSGPALSEDPPVAAIQRHARSVRKASDSWRTQLPRPEKQEFTEGKQYLWKLETSEGPITIKLMADVAPMHVTSTIYLTELGFYDGLTFHRVIPRFMAQGGCPLGNGTGEPGYAFDGEFDREVVHDRAGLLSMANRGPGTDGSQFFITFRSTRSLDGKHTIYGEVIDGMGTVRKLEQAGTASGKPQKPLTIEQATISVRDA